MKKTNSDISSLEKVSTELIPACLGDEYEDVKFDMENGISVETLTGTGVFTKCRISTRAGISGKYNGEQFRQTDAIVDFSDKEVRSCSGRLLFCLNDRKADSTVVVKIKDELVTPYEITFGQTHYRTKPVAPTLLRYRRDEKFETESVEFNKLFDCYGKEHDGFYVLTPKMIENIIRLKEKNRGQLFVVFRGDWIIMGIFDGKKTFDMTETDTSSGNSLLIGVMNDVNAIKNNINIIKGVKK